MLTKALARCIFLEAIASGLMLVSSGCGGNDNEREFARTAAPGIPSDRPNESFADRRARTRIVTKSEQKLEDRNKVAAEKKAAAETKKAIASQ
jgi:hypothetical protein